MKKYVLLIIAISVLLVMAMGNLSAQELDPKDSFFEDNVSLNVGATVYQEYGFDDMMFSLDGLYRINNWFETGLFATYINNNYIFEVNEEFVKTHSMGLYYGAEARFHILPIHDSQSCRKFDIYANTQLGAKSIIYDKDLRNEKLMRNHTKAFVNGSVGLGYSFNQHFGIFYECGYSNTDRMNYKFGLNLKL